jgi:hypothetical protein
MQRGGSTQRNGADDTLIHHTPGWKARLSAVLYIESVVLSMYLSAALGRAQYELLEDGEGFYGSIPELQGVWAQGATLEACRAELASVLLLCWKTGCSSAFRNK